MRTDEEYVKNSINVYLEKHHSFVGNIIEGEDPPDYYVLESNKKIALEITTAESTCHWETKKAKRKTYTESVDKFCNELNNQFQNKIPKGESLQLVIKIPLLDFNRFRKLLSTELNKLMLRYAEFFSEEFNINGETVKIKKVVHNDNWRKSIIGIIATKNSDINDINIKIQTQRILKKIINEKVSKLKKINNEKWLGILNNYFLAEHNLFSQALHEMNDNHGFSKIFLIGDNSEVFEIQKTTN